MPQQLSTAISDLALALSSFHSIYTVHKSTLIGQFGFLLIGLAASVGAYRFGLENPSTDVIKLHKTLSWLAQVIGITLLSATYCQKGHIHLLGNILIASSISVLLLTKFLDLNVAEIVTDGLSGVCVVTIFLVSMCNFNPPGVLGAVGYAFGTLAVGTKGEIRGIPSVDIFHYVLFLANIALAFGLSQQPELTYNKKD